MYCLKFDNMVAFVDKGQLQCALIRVKLSGLDSNAIFNMHANINQLIFDSVLLKEESDRDVLPALLYRGKAKVIEGVGGILKRIEQRAKEAGIDCRVVSKINNNAASVFFFNTPTISCQMLETDKEELHGKTLYIGADRDVDYVGDNIIPIVTDENFDVPNEVLGTRIFSLTDHRHTMQVLVKANV